MDNDKIEKIAGLTTKQSAFLIEYAKTDNLSQACRVANINRSTGYKYLENEDFRLALEEMKTKIVNAAWTKMSSSLESAVAKVVDIMEDPNTTTNAKLRAAELVFTYSSRHNEGREIIARMDRLEELFNAE